MMTVIATIASVNLSVYAQSTEDDEESLNDSCRETGFNDGQSSKVEHMIIVEMKQMATKHIMMVS
jgi:hypothetical protein